MGLDAFCLMSYFGLSFSFAEMNATPQTRSVSRGTRPQSLLFRDLSTSPATRSSTFKGENRPIAATSWREDITGGPEHPPPPIFSLEDRLEPASGFSLFDSPANCADSMIEDVKSPPSRSPVFNLRSRSPAIGTPDVERLGPRPLFASSPFQSFQQHRNIESPNLWSPLKEDQVPDRELGRDVDKESGMSVSAVLQQPQQHGGLLTLPPIREIVTPDASFQSNGNGYESNDFDHEWVTAFGFAPDDTNFVMRELEKCGTILRHVPGPAGANWIHVQFQNKYEARKALYKNGIQIGGALIIGVKPMEPLQRQALVEKDHRAIFNVIPPNISAHVGLPGPPKASARSCRLEPNGESNAMGSIASPSKSVLSKIADLVFGL